MKKRLKFSLLGMEIEVKYVRNVSKLYAKKCKLSKNDFIDVHAFCVFEENTIYMDNKLKHNTDLHDLTLKHEILHFIFYLLNEYELNNNEKLIDTLANCLMQVEKSLSCY